MFLPVVDTGAIEAHRLMTNSWVPLPAFWGGYLLIPHAVEFWAGRPDRLHDRVESRRGADGSWHRRRLQP